MAKRASTGRNEVGMMSDLKSIAEQVGREVLGFDIEWVIETTATEAKRPDVEIREMHGNRELIISGEAKKPEVPEGIHPFVASEVHGAIQKARSLGGAYAFTTNFLGIAIFDVERYEEDNYLGALIGSDAIAWIDEEETTVAGWWSALTKDRLEALARPGLEALFTKVRELRVAASAQPPVNPDEVYLSIFRQATDQLVANSVPALESAFNSMTLPNEVLVEAKARDFDFKQADVVRYFVAQAVAEILTSGLFYQTIRPMFGLKPLLKGLRPATSELLLKTVEDSLAEATKVTGDYETIFGLSAGAKWLLEVDSAQLRAHWIYLFETLAAVRFDKVTSDIIGVIFERLISAERRQEMGQHYTQSRLARAMTSWAMDEDDDLVVDFSAGGGTFLVEAYTKLRAHMSHEQVLSRVFGNDLDSFAVHLSTVNLATRDIYKGHNFPAVSNHDAFDIRPGSPAVEVTPVNGDEYRVDYPQRFDVVLGNPPYDEKADGAATYRTALSEIAGGGGISVLPKGMKDDVNLAAWFILLSAAWLTDDGRIALVLPTAILQNEKHATLMVWLRSRFDITVWHTESDVWFSDARVSPITLFMAPRAETTSDYGSFTFVNVLEPVGGDIDESSPYPLPVEPSIVRDLTAVEPSADALIEGTRPDALRAFEEASGTFRLGDHDDISVFRGNKLGHPFYKMKDRDPASTGAIRSLTGFDIQTKINSKYLTPLMRSPKDEATGEFDPAKVDWWILSAPKTLPAGGELERYVRAAKRAGAADAPSVKAKGTNWWSVNWKTTRLLVSAHPQFQHQTWWCDEPFVATDNFQAVGFADGWSKEDQEVVAASLSSAFGALSALYRSNEVGCEGVRWVSTANLLGWYSIVPSLVQGQARAELLAAYRAYRKHKAAKIHEMRPAVLEDWRRLTVAVAAVAGMGDPADAAEAALAEAKKTTIRRREREVVALSGRTRAGSSGGAKLLRDIKKYTEALPEFLAAVTALSDGDSTLKIKKVEETTAVAMFDLDDESTKASVGNRLVAILGEGFESAPIWADETVEKVEAVFSSVKQRFIGNTGSDGVPAGLAEVERIVRESVSKSLQATVKKRLS